MPARKDFDWELHPELEEFVLEIVDSFVSRHTFARKLSKTMLTQSSTRFIDWIDHLVLPASNVEPKTLTGLGLEEIEASADAQGRRVFRHKGSYLFPILLSKTKEYEVALKPENLDDFVQVLGLGLEVEGEPFAPLRKAVVRKEGHDTLSALERRGYRGFVATESGDTSEYLRVLSSFYRRRRLFESDEEGMLATEGLVKKSLAVLDSARVADAFFKAERSYWQARNRAGQVQKTRQDSLGLGWGNHDHHTYRSSRASFPQMIRIFEAMGYECRERYYAGAQAGWGAQILEHPVCDIVVFTDVDLNPRDARVDFAHKGFREKERKLGTVGLWVGLHGESILQAGMHHLEARFDFEKLGYDLGKLGVGVMSPFSRFEFLKQAFTAGEVWPVEKARLEKLASEGYITRSRFEKFLKEGAIGSHLENLQRDQGFKGFNRSSVTKIIMRTDPRKQRLAGALA